MKCLVLIMLAAVASARLAPLLKQELPIPGQYMVKLKAGESVEGAISVLGETKILHKYKTVFPGFAAVLTDNMVEQLRSLDAVEYIEEDGVVFASEVASWGLDRVDQLALPLNDVFEPIGDGAGVDVYVIDTGINPNHIDFGERAEIGEDTLGGDGVDCNGHGTHCSGTVGGTRFGVAKQVNIIGVRTLSCAGSGAWSAVAAACDWVANVHEGPSVASMSLGGGVSALVDEAVESMINAGVSVAVAAGNSYGNACNYSPARVAPAITVGATDDSDTRASFSNYGQCLDIFAPGVDIPSAWIGQDDAENIISGTSMACPHVAGAAAVLLGIDASLTPSEVKADLQLRSIANAVDNIGGGSPNLLLYIGEGSGGGFIPPPPPEPAGCGGHFNESSGSFFSPNFPNDYGNNENCYFLFTRDGSTAEITFISFDLEQQSTCSYDILRIYDGPDALSPEIGYYCGTNSPGTVVSTGNSLFMHFKSDSSIGRVGFEGTYSFALEPETGGCGHEFTREEGIVTSPNYPEKYGDLEDCVFVIRGEAGKTVTLTFDAFDIENHTGCDYDALEIRDGDENGAVLARLCGSTLPDPVTSLSSSLHIRLISDGSVTRGGFSSTYIIS